MTKLLKIENLLIVFYILLLAVTCVALFWFRLDEKILVPAFIGLFCIAPFVIFFGAANRISPFWSKIFLVIFGFVTILLFIPSVKFSYCLPIPLLIAFMFLINRERRVGFERWLKTNKFSPVPHPPTDILQTLGEEKYWQCHANSFFPANGREVPYLIWFGTSYTSSTTMINGITRQTKTQVSHTAISFFPNTVSETFKQNLETDNLDNKSFFQKLSLKTQEQSPYLTKTLLDGTFVCAWTTLHIASILDEKLKGIKTLLEKSF